MDLCHIWQLINLIINPTPGFPRLEFKYSDVLNKVRAEDIKMPRQLEVPQLLAWDKVICHQSSVMVITHNTTYIL